MNGDGKAGLHPAKEIFVVVDAEVGIDAALEQDLNAAEIDGLLQLLRELVLRQRVHAAVAHGPVEIAELTGRGAGVGVVDVAVDDVRHNAVRMQRLPTQIGRAAQVEKRRRFMKLDAFIEGQARSGGSIREQAIERAGRRRPHRRGRAFLVEEARSQRNRSSRQEPQTMRAI